MKFRLMWVLLSVCSGASLLAAPSAELLAKANAGNAQAQFDVGKSYAADEKESESIKWYRRAAANGLAEAQWAVGMTLVFDGDMSPKEIPEALELLRKSAAQEHVESEAFLAWMYNNGVGVAKDSSEAVRWYRKAANRGHVGSEYTLGLLYASGNGVPKDEVEGVAWLNLAAASKYKDAAKWRDKLSDQLGDAGRLEAQRRSRELFEKIEASRPKPSK